MTHELTVDLERCIGSGNCVLIAPALFDQDDVLGQVRLLPPARGPLPDDAARAATEALGACPSGALRLVPAPTRSPTDH